MIIAIIRVLFGMITNVFSLIPVIGSLIGIVVMFFLYVPFIVFTSRYAALIYERGEDRMLADTISQAPGAPTQ